MVDQTAPVPLYLQIQRELRGQIRSGELSPGARIPSEQALAARHGVSRMTARKAIEGLVARGLVFRRPGKGTFVTEDHVSDGLSTMLSLSRTLQARGYSVGTVVLQQEIIPGPRDVLQALKLEAGSEVVAVRRLRGVGGTPVAIHTAYLDARRFAALLEVDLASRSLLESIEGICDVRDWYTKDAVWAKAATAGESALLGIPAGGPVLALEGVVYDEQGRPTRLSRAIYRGDKFRLVVKNTSSQASLLLFQGN